MRKLILGFLLLVFTMVVFANTGTSPPIETTDIEVVIETNNDFSGYESPDINPINFEGVAISTGGTIETDITAWYIENRENSMTFIMDKSNEAIIHSNFSKYQVRQHNRQELYNKNHADKVITLKQKDNKKKRCLFLYSTNQVE